MEDYIKSTPDSDVQSQSDATSVEDAEKKQQPAEEKASDTEKQKKEDAINWEKRYKDTQKAFTKSRQELAELRAQLKVLQEQVKAPEPTIDDDKKKELDELKLTDPDRWYREMKALEDSAQKELSERVNKLSEREKELVRREMVLEEFLEANPDVVINNEIIKYDVPARITKKLEDGKITFEQFLNEVKEFLTRPKKIAEDQKPPQQKDIGSVGGSDTPKDTQTKDDAIKTYVDAVL